MHVRTVFLDFSGKAWKSVRHKLSVQSTSLQISPSLVPRPVWALKGDSRAEGSILPQLCIPACAKPSSIQVTLILAGAAFHSVLQNV